MDGQEKKLKIVLESENRANKEIDQVIVKLEKITTLLQQTMLATKAVATHTSTSFDKVEKSATKVGTAINKSFNFKQVSANVMRLTRILLNSMDKSVKYIENLNLFEVAMKKNIQSAHEFTSVLAESFGMDKSEIIRYQGLFANLAESMGNTTDSAYGVSKALTTVAYDLASLYNISTASAMEKLSAGLVGQTKPLRTIGIDTTYQTLEKYSKELGIGTAIKNLSQADKQLLRTIAIIRQSKNAWGDMAKTIETPANQLRVFANQIAKVGRAIGNVFIGLFSKILPYANAFLMVVYELLTVLASLVGFEMPTYNKDNQYSSIADDLDDAGDSADDLKKKLGLLSFDELNNFITKSETADASSSYGGILDEEINRLMDEYNDKLDKAKMKATEIRDRIMEWLGFTKKINEETGEVYFAFEKLTSGAVLSGLAILSAPALLKGLKSLLKVFGTLLGSKATGTAIASIGKTASGVIAPIALIVLAIAGLIAGLVNVYSKSEDIQNSFKNAIKSCFEPMKDLFKEIIEVGKTIIDTFKNMFNALTPVWEFLKGAFTDVWNKMIIPAVKYLGETVIPALTNAFKVLNDKVLKPLGEFIESVFTPVIEIISDVLGFLWKNIILPLANAIGGVLAKAFEGFMSIMTKTVLPVIGTVIKVLTWLWENVLEPIVSFLWDVLSPVVEEVFKNIGVIIEGLGTTLGGIIDFITGVFTLDWKLAWQGIKDIFSGIWTTISNILKAPFNLILTIFEKLINKIVDGWNYLKRAINSLSVKIPDWLGGGTIGFNLKMSEHVALPKLADGGIITQPMIYRNTLTGENYKKEAIIPLQNTRVIQDFSNVIGDNVLEGLSSLINSQPIENRIYIDDTQVARTINKRNNELNNQFGK